jgi:hypothetical protein
MTIPGVTTLRAPLNGTNAFLARINALGSPDWFLFLSGTGEDVATGGTVIGSNVYVSGWTTSSDFLGRTGTTCWLRHGPPPSAGGSAMERCGR